MCSVLTAVYVQCTAHRQMTALSRPCTGTVNTDYMHCWCTEDAIKILGTRLRNACRIVATKTLRQILHLSNSNNIVRNRQIYVMRQSKPKPVSRNAVLVQLIWLVLSVTAVQYRTARYKQSNSCKVPHCTV